MNETEIHHKSRVATYIHIGDGMLERQSKVKSEAVAYLKNDEEGQRALKLIRSIYRPQLRVLYRCPSNGRTYDETTGRVTMHQKIGMGRVSQLPKSEAMVMVVCLK